MPAQLFVDSEDDNEDFGSGGEDNSGDSDYEGVEEEDTKEAGEVDGEQKGKKRKLGKTKKGTRGSKKAKKLGPKEVKGAGRREEKLSAEEIKELTAKEYAQYSNLYNVQIEEVLQETRVSEKRKSEVVEWVDEFKRFVEGMGKSKKFPMEEWERKMSPVKVPLPSKVLQKVEEWVKGHSWQWMPPSSVDIRGSWAVDTWLSKVSAVDVFVEMPYDYLVKSDGINHKYHFKRALYLGWLAKKMEKRGDAVRFTVQNGEPLKPVINVKVGKIQVLIHAVPPKEYFKVKKMTCDKNNLRYEYFFKKEKDAEDPETSTQHYNRTILEDSLVGEVNKEVSKFLKKRPQFKDAIKLLKIWLAQRELLKGYGGFSGFIITQFMRYLLKVGKITENMTAFQLIRVFFISLIQVDLSENGISFCENADMALAQMQWDVVFLDSTGLLNYTGNVSKFTLKRIQYEAKRALSIIDRGNVTGFLALFVTRVKFMQNFDHVIRFSKLDKLGSCLQAKSENESIFLDHSGFLYPVVISAVGPLIETCLGQRINVLDVELAGNPEWNVTDNVPKHIPTVIRFGFNINRESSQKLIEKCESDSEHQVEVFKEFWGDKSELRRYQDGTLLESVVLDNLCGLGKSRICFQMLCYIFNRHLGYQLSQDEYIDKQIENLVEAHYLKIKPLNVKQQPGKKMYLHGKLIQKKSNPNQESTEPVSVDLVTRLISNSFDELSKILRQLEELPLAISTVQGLSSVLRFSHIQPTPPQTFLQCKMLTEVDTKSKRKAMLLKKGVTAAIDDSIEELEGDDAVATKATLILPKKVPKYVEPVGVIIHLEASGQWPDDMKAIERLKCAFLIKIGELLKNKFGLTVQPYARHLDVLKDGFVFRIRITYFRELTLLRQLRGADGVLRVRDNPESLRLEKEALILPQLTSTLHSFHLQYEAFGKTCRIAKRWVASQLLLSSPLEYNRNLEEPECRMSEESIELLVAYQFLNYAPHLSFPSEAHVGFQRFIYMMANTDFRAVPIIVNFNDKLSSQEVSQIELEFVKMRCTLSPLFIATPFDQKGSVWTRHLSQVILSRLQLLAKQALTIMENYFENVKIPQSGLLAIFRPSTDQFDVIIRLKKQLNPRSFQSIESVSNPVKFKQYCKKQDELIPVVDFDPVQMYLQDLRNSFGHLAIFLHDLFGGQFIAVVWKPDVFKSSQFSASTCKGKQLGTKGTSITTNVNAVLESFRVMGEGIIDQVETNSDRWTFED